MDSEYPEVDGPLSVISYITALDSSYSTFREKHARAQSVRTKVASLNGHSNGHANGHANGNGHLNGENGHAQSETAPSDPKATISLDDFDYHCFHSPYGKQVQKGHARLLYNDFLSNPESSRFSNVPSPADILAISYKESLSSKVVEKTFLGIATQDYKTRVSPSMSLAKRCGNMYTASLYGGLASLVANVEPTELLGKRLSLYAYGSGCASSFYAIRVRGDTSEIRDKLDLQRRLKSMNVVPCEDYVTALKVRVSYFFATAISSH